MQKKLLILGLLIPFFFVGCSNGQDGSSASSIASSQIPLESSPTSEGEPSLSSLASSEASSESALSSDSNSSEIISSSEESSSTTIPVSSVSLNQSTLDIDTNSKGVTLTATVLPADATNKAVTWTSSDTSVATVDNGAITPLEEGNTTITATTVDGNKTATCNVTVYEYKPIPDHVIHIKYADETEWGDEAMSVNSYSLSEYMIQGLALKANDVFKIHMSGDIWYGYSAIKSATPSGLVAAASSDDNIKVLSSGTYDIYCDYNQDGDGKHIYLAKTGNVDPTPSVVHVTDVSLSRNGKFLEYRNEYQLTATVYPSHANNKNVFWSSSDTDIATVTNAGRVIAKSKKGSTIITATTEDGAKTDTCIVYVSPDAYPDYYLTGTINGKSRDVSYRKNLAGVPLGDGRYLISDVQLQKGDSLRVYSEKGMYWIRDKSYRIFEYEVNVTAYVNIYFNPNAANDEYLTLVNKGSKEIYVTYPRDTNDDGQCAWIWVSGNDIQPQWIKSSSLHIGSTGSEFLIPNKATSFTFARASKEATPTEEYGSIGAIKRIVGPIEIVDGTYAYDVSE